MTPIVPAELIAYNALNRPEDDVTLTGGGRDPDQRPDFTQMPFNDTIEIVSDNCSSLGCCTRLGTSFETVVLASSPIAEDLGAYLVDQQIIPVFE